MAIGLKNLAVAALLTAALPIAADSFGNDNYGNDYATESNKKSDSDNNDKVDLTPHIHGTVRAKYEYQTEEGEGRFEVRNARLSVAGNVARAVEYKAEIDLSEEGQIKMLDAFTRIKPFTGFSATIGQMRVPFTIDAHRSPHQQYFANRSFIAKQVGNVRDVGLTAGYSFNCGIPVILEAGIFNGSGLTNQKNFWTKKVNFSAKAQFFFPQGFNLTLSTQKISPNSNTIMMYDAGAYWQKCGWHIEAEYLYKHYSHDAFTDVQSVNTFACYDFNLHNKEALVKKISPLVRYDYMTDHSDGTLDDDGKMKLTDYKRSRVTAGVTFSLAKPFVSDIRLNFEKYFYGDGAVAKTSEKDKIVLEVMTRF